MKGKVLLGIIATFLIGLPCYADGGIPLWMLSCSSTFLTTGFQEEPILFIAITLILLLLVSLVETFVINAVLKIKNFVRAFWITLKANLVSTIVGSIFTLFLFDNENITSLLWWSNKWCILNNLILHIIMLILSYYVEYYVAKRDLIEYKLSDIKKSFLFANILSYILFPTAIIILSLLLDYASTSNMQTKSQQYEKINYKSIDNIVVTKSAFIPEPVSKKECKKLKKELGIVAKCDAEPDYWTGAVKACGGIEHLYSENQFQEIVKKVYNTSYNNSFFNETVAKQYGLPIDFLPPEIIKKHSFSQQDYDEYRSKYPMHAWIFTNEAFHTSSPYIGQLYARASNFHTEGYKADNFPKSYAICINNK